MIAILYFPVGPLPCACKVAESQTLGHIIVSMVLLNGNILRYGFLMCSSFFVYYCCIAGLGDWSVFACCGLEEKVIGMLMYLLADLTGFSSFVSFEYVQCVCTLLSRPHGAESWKSSLARKRKFYGICSAPTSMCPFKNSQVAQYGWALVVASLRLGKIR